jgi:hypothetical protein
MGDDEGVGSAQAMVELVNKRNKPRSNADCLLYLFIIFILESTALPCRKYNFGNMLVDWLGQSI